MQCDKDMRKINKKGDAAVVKPVQPLSESVQHDNHDFSIELSGEGATTLCEIEWKMPDAFSEIEGGYVCACLDPGLLDSREKIRPDIQDWQT